tara:strand:- start:2695 stop:3843 length:1149 start_codon:yes stop_codon:yes gene_type:complete
MSNVLTDLAADIYKAADTVGRELVGFIPSTTINGDATTRAAKGDTIRAAFTRTPTLNTSFAPAMTIPEGTDQTVDNKVMTLDNYLSVQIPWTGEDIKHVNNGSGYETIYGDQISQAIRAICNKIEQDVASAAYKGASRAVGAAGTTPFAANFDLIAEARQILIDNGCPNDNQLSLILNSAAGTKLRNLASLQQVNTSGNEQLLRQGTLLDLQGLMMKESAGIVSHTKGAGTSYVTSGSTAVGTKDIALVTGSGIVLAGDVVTFAADANNKYVVGTGVTAPGTLSLNETGARIVIPTANAMTVGASYTPNVAFHKSAIELGIRPPALPNGGDSAVDMMTVQDPKSGLVFEIAVYKGYMKTMLEVRCLYGVKVWKPDFVATLMG